MADNALQHLGVAVITGAFVVDYIPILKHLDGCQAQDFAF